MKLLFLALVALPLLCLTANAAATKKVAAPLPEVFSHVTAINAKANQITIVFRKGDTVLDKKPTTYTVDDFTTVTINSVTGKFADIKVGMFVMGTTERDAHTLDNITLQTTQPQAVQAGANN